MHLCAVTSRADDALAVYNLMRLETDPHNLPDVYTYAALVRAIVMSKRYEMASSVSSFAPVLFVLFWGSSLQREQWHMKQSAHQLPSLLQST